MLDLDYVYSVALPLAEFAYNVKECPPGWTVVAPIQPDNFGFVAAKGVEEVAVCFRGTETEFEWAEDGFAVPWPNPLGPGEVHKGFLDAYTKVVRSVHEGVDAARKLAPKASVRVVGHSLGGALSILAALDLSSLNPCVYTFASPRVCFGVVAANSFDLHIPQCLRVENRVDIVPHLPSDSLGWRHVGTAIVLDGGPAMNSNFNVHVAHNLRQAYAPGLVKLIGEPVK